MQYAIIYLSNILFYFIIYIIPIIGTMLLDILSNVCLKGKIFVHKVKGCINYNTFECVIILFVINTLILQLWLREYNIVPNIGIKLYILSTNVIKKNIINVFVIIYHKL
jgi:hypothetical protein